jgi:hypothetical protein
MNPVKRIIKLSKIDLEHSPNVRAELNDEAIEEYTQGYRLKEKFPECVLFDASPGPLLLADGRHRYHSMLKAGINERTFLVYKGSYEMCLKFALQANLDHGLRRTNADKRTSVLLAIQNFPKMSNNVIAEIAAVGDDLVREVRTCMESTGKVNPTEKRTGKDGREYKADYRKTIVAGGENSGNKGKSEDSKNGTPKPAAAENDVEKDATGYPMAPAAKKFWDRRHEVDVFIEALRAVRHWVTQALEHDDRLVSAEIRNTFLIDIGNVITQLECALPYAVCPYCQGKLPDKCQFCAQRGIVSKFRLKAAPAEVMKVREKMCKTK